MLVALISLALVLMAARAGRRDPKARDVRAGGTPGRAWPDFRIVSMIVDPEVPWRVLVLVQRLDPPGGGALMVLDTAGESARSARLLQGWRDDHARVSARSSGIQSLALHSRHSPERVLVRVIGERRAA